MCTIIGLPLGIIGLVLYGVAIYLSQIPVSLLIGKLIIMQKKEPDSIGSMIGALALGLVILLVLGLIPVIGWIINLLVIIFGLGALVTSEVRLRSGEE